MATTGIAGNDPNFEIIFTSANSIRVIDDDHFGVFFLDQQMFAFAHPLHTCPRILWSTPSPRDNACYRFALDTIRAADRDANGEWHTFGNFHLIAHIDDSNIMHNFTHQMISMGYEIRREPLQIQRNV